MDNTQHSIGIWISILYRYRKIFVSKKLEDYGVVAGLHLIIMTLYKCKGASQEKISEFLKIDKTTTAKSIKKLEEEGFVRRETDPVDRRAYKVYLTDKALDIVPKIQKALKDWDEMVIAGVSDESYQAAEQLLKTMAENAYYQYSSHAIKDCNNK